MNATATLSILTKRELEVAEMLALGASKKRTAARLFISERTVENHTRSIYKKVGISKASELSAWFISTKYNISDLSSPLLKRGIVALFVVIVLLFSADFILSSAMTRDLVQTEGVQ